jgi:tetratricopeptide (TPR) repeat protein
MRTTTRFAASCAVLFCLAARLSGQSADRLLVIPFDNAGHEATAYWLGEASAVLIADDLSALGRLTYTREERLEAFDQLQLPSVAGLSRATMIRLGHLVGATQVVIGTYRITDGRIAVQAQKIRLDTGRIDSEFQESGALEDLFAVFERVSRRLANSAASDQKPLGSRPALPVFENYIKGLVASSVTTKVNYLQAALKLDPGFHRARLALWSVYQDQGNVQAALATAAAVPEASPLYPDARFNVALSLLQLKRFDDAFATLKVLSDRNPAATVFNNLGVIQMRRPSTPDTGRATYYFNQAVKADQDDPDYYFNLGYAYWAEKDSQSAIFWLREAVRRDPADGEAHAVLAAALQATGAATEAARERELATQLSSTYAESTAKPAGSEPIPRNLERVKPTLEMVSVRNLDSAIGTAGQRDQRQLAAFHLDRGRRFFDQGSDTEAVAELRRTLYLSPYLAEAHLLLGKVYLRTGQTQAAIDAFKIAIWSEESPEAQIALAQAYVQAKDDDKALAAVRRALVLAPDSSEAKTLLTTLQP